MDRFGDAFGVAFAIEGIFFFLEAIFIAIYIYGWDRLSPKAHMWAAVPIVVSGVGGAFSVIAANSWMNQPQGFTLDSAGKVTDVKPLEVLTNSAAGYEFAHMLLAAYMVTGFLLASVYAVGMLRGKRDRYHRFGVVIPLTVAAIATPIQFFVGDTAARAIADDQPAKFAGMECIYKGGPDQTEYLGGRCVDGKVKGGIGIPGLDSFLVGFSKDTDVTGLNQIPKDEQPPALTMLHLSFDTMVGVGTLLFLLAAWFAIVWLRKRDLPQTKWFLRAVAISGVAAVVALECGWIVTEVGRQPWIVNGFMRTSEAVTPAQGIWWVFGITLRLHRPRGDRGRRPARALPPLARGQSEEGELPYSPPPEPATEASRMSTADVCAVILWVGVTLYAIFGGADFGAGDLDLLAGSGERADRVRQQIDRSIGPVWEANHVWLIFVLVVLWTAFPTAFSAMMTTLYIPLALAALGIVLRGSGFAFRHALPGPIQGPATQVFGVASVLTPFFMGTVVGAIASGEVPAVGDGDPTGSWTGFLPLVTGALFVAVAAYTAAVFLVRDSGAAGDDDLRDYFARRALAIAVVAGIARRGRRHRAPPGRALHLRRAYVMARNRARGSLGRLRARGARTAGHWSERGPARRGSRRRDSDDLGLLRGRLPLHAADLAEDLGRRGRLRHSHRGDRGLRGRRRHGRAVSDPALRALPAQRVGIASRQ